MLINSEQTVDNFVDNSHRPFFQSIKKRLEIKLTGCFY
ncbi:hypothetical protein PNIG_a3518 [Pseudoalteromonas nigrifaciens]|uniref:Uncharacterized protein n=2 Tax=Pseudoalteromonas TaxID=53246 RepID=A0AAC9UME7_9GAMM|nr:hypothetical protein PTRA_a3303 [Pseudoalteromonas translucida KMM 520]ASM55402.1 hypothetical protein PNIG_a3518 [Pseudoalteromonas nigrifaciens]SJN30043.1 hypothetical protein CZ797_05970 [Pseudoalteromonas sp. JB197]